MFQRDDDFSTPINSIGDAMNHTLSSVLDKYARIDMGNDHYLMVVTSIDLRCLFDAGLVMNWSCNRPHDQLRVEEIRNQLILTKHLSGTIKMAQIDNCEFFTVYDGVHRLLALCSCNLPSINVAIDVMFHCREAKVKEEFMQVNKSIPVPSLYTPEVVSHNLRCMIEDFVTKLAQAHSSLTSTSRACHKPNFNVDICKDDIYELFTSMKLDKSRDEVNNFNLFVRAIFHLDRVYRDSSKIPSCIKDKCERAGLYLFCEGRTISRDKLELSLMNVRGR